MTRIIQRDRSVVPACDVPLEVFKSLVEQTADIEGIGGYKVGPALCGRPGYDTIVAITRAYTNKPLIFDAQKWGTDIPDTAPSILGPVKESGIDAVILFPQSGPITEYEWIKTAQGLGLGVIVGGEMTHPRYPEGDYSNSKTKNYTKIFMEELGMNHDVTGFIREMAPEDMYEIAARMGVTDFVVPGNKPDKIIYYRELIEKCGCQDASYWSPGLVAQGGNISEGAKAAGKIFNGIVGRGIYNAKDMRAAAIEHCSQLD